MEDKAEFKKIYSKILFYNNTEKQELISFRLTYNVNFAQYYMFLYQIIKILEKTLNDKKSFSKSERDKYRKYYGNILRANVPAPLMQLLMVSVIGKYKTYSKYIKKYQLLEHMPFFVLKKIMVFPYI